MWKIVQLIQISLFTNSTVDMDIHFSPKGPSWLYLWYTYAKSSSIVLKSSRCKFGSLLHIIIYTAQIPSKWKLLIKLDFEIFLMEKLCSIKKWFKFTVFACCSVSYKVLWVWQTQVCNTCPATLLWKIKWKVKLRWLI